VKSVELNEIAMRLKFMKNQAERRSGETERQRDRETERQRDREAREAEKEGSEINGKGVTEECLDRISKPPDRLPFPTRGKRKRARSLKMVRDGTPSKTA